ncbi:hypothetical protein [Peribacillus simplex]|uniref:hypothetical protein n=1 Tax=Peribacillus simplex TaxID=1478 RepID=UPI00119FB075|nr:hypothetical protein [Peribacillus simplex]
MELTGQSSCIKKWEIDPNITCFMLAFKEHTFSKGLIMQKTFIVVSYSLFFVPLIFIVNFLFDIVTLEKIEGLPIFFPLVFCLFGLFFASKAHKIQKDVLTIGAIIVNSVLLFFPFIYMILGTVIFGV